MSFAVQLVKAAFKVIDVPVRRLQRTAAVIIVAAAIISPSTVRTAAWNYVQAEASVYQRWMLMVERQVMCHALGRESVAAAAPSASAPTVIAKLCS